MFEPDEFIFTKLAYYFKRKKKEKKETLSYLVKLEDIQSRLTIFSRAITGEAIDIYPAHREGGYKNNNFFLPNEYALFKTWKDNLSFYLFRILYLSVQKNLGLNWTIQKDYGDIESRLVSEQKSNQVLKVLFKDFPITKTIHQQLITQYQLLAGKNKEVDLSFIYGKYMFNTEKTGDKSLLKEFNDHTKSADTADKTIIKAKAAEDLISVQMDKKQLEDAVLQHQFEKVETADEFNGNWRDMDGDDELEDHVNALDEINMKYTVRTDDTSHSVYQADFIENTTIKESAENDSKGFYIQYDEWQYTKRQYKEKFCKVYPKTILKTNAEYLNNTLSDNQCTLNGLRKMLTSVNNKYKQVYRQSQGEELDIDAITDLFIDIHTGHTPSENIYFSKRKKEKDLSILLLLDTSLSSDGYAAGNRVIDVEKQVSILFGEILNEFQIDFAIDSFYSKTRNHSSYITAKGFDDSWQKSKLRIGALEPNGYTRIGAAIRHAGALIEQRPSKNKWIILLSDGKPNDYDKYEGKYGIQDVKQAIHELNQKHINSYALAIEAQAKYYLPQMFGQNHYQILSNPNDLLKSLVKLYEKIKFQK